MRLRKAVSLIEILVSISVVLILVGLLLPAVQAVRESGYRIATMNKTKQLGLAVHTIESTQGFVTGIYEPIITLNEQDHQYNNLFVDIARILNIDGDQSRLFFINVADPSFYFRKDNNSVFDEHSLIRNPHIGNTSFSFNGQIGAKSKFEFDDVTDGLSNTIFFSERYGNLCNGVSFFFSESRHRSNLASIRRPMFAESPTSDIFDDFELPEHHDFVPLQLGIPTRTTSRDGSTFQVRPKLQGFQGLIPPTGNCDPRLLQTPFRSGLIVGLGDGSVRQIRPTISPEIFWGAISPHWIDASFPD
ncbi:MAG: DUF1559 domain-containing protein [Gemmataceae bacterium]|jgi:type II secretory pathway pseudopilin PulG|nr:DUF1559 domain-containing protein [Gemmataceae bacterium]